MELEFYQELFLTAVISILFAFLLGKIAGRGRDDGERSEVSAASSYFSCSGENFGRQADEGLRAAADVFGTSEQLRDSETEIAAVEELGGGVEVVQENIEEKTFMDNVGEEEEISEKMPVSADIERHSGEDVREEETDEEEKEAASSSSDVPTVRGQWTEIESGRGESVSTENKGGSLLHDEDEWEGIERSELEKLFVQAAEYSVSTSGSPALSQLSSDVQMELYGLHKIATEGPCYESQPLSLKVSARARWHAWQKLGRMTPEIAMEQYISLLSKSIPGWVVENYRDAELKRAADIPEKGTLDVGDPELATSLQKQLSPTTQMKLEDQDSEIDITTGGMKVLEQGLTGTFLFSLLSPTRGVFS